MRARSAIFFASPIVLLLVIATVAVHVRAGARQPLQRVNPSAAAASAADCGPRALLIACLHLGVSARLDTLRKYAGTTASGTSMLGLQKAAEAYGLHATGVQVAGAAVEQIPTPAIAWIDENHYIAVLSIHGDRVLIHDPNHQNEEVISTDDLLRRSAGYLLLISH